MQNSRGFTLVELIVVIVIIGILAATALPRFINLGTDARIASVKTLEGSVRTAMNLARMTCAIQSTCLAGSSSLSGSTIKLNGKIYSINYGYPTGGIAGSDGIDTMVNINGYSISTAGTGTTNFSITSAPTAANCAVSYTSAVDANNPPVVASVTSGC